MRRRFDVRKWTSERERKREAAKDCQGEGGVAFLLFVAPRRISIYLFLSLHQAEIPWWRSHLPGLSNSFGIEPEEMLEDLVFTSP